MRVIVNSLGENGGKWRKMDICMTYLHRNININNTGVGKCPMTWVYWTSPYSSHLVDHTPNGWVM